MGLCFRMFRRQTVLRLIAALVVSACNNPAPAAPAAAPQPLVDAGAIAAPSDMPPPASLPVAPEPPVVPVVPSPCAPNQDCTEEDAGAPDPDGAPLSLPCDVSDI